PKSQAQKLGRFRLSDSYRESNNHSILYSDPDQHITELKYLAGLSPEETAMWKMGLDPSQPFHSTLLDVNKLMVPVFMDEDCTRHRPVWVNFEEARDYEFANYDVVRWLRSYTLTIAIELDPEWLGDWPRDNQGRPELNCRALQMQGWSGDIPQPNYFMLSRRWRQPPLANCMYFLKTPIWRTRNIDPETRDKCIKYYYAVRAMLCRKFGGASIKKDGFSYNPFWKGWTDPEHAPRFRIMRQESWTLDELKALALKMPDCNRRGRAGAILDAIKAGGESQEDIRKRFNVPIWDVRKIAREHGIRKPKRSHKPEDINRVRYCKGRNLSQRETSRETSFSLGKVQGIWKVI
ncbi:MAG: hypothetical protein OXI24_16865, partial [Candidatus Poribacteria bacterium]|nr:hypothetical protein [Candidatus Poribacteria bacterium]